MKGLSGGIYYTVDWDEMPEPERPGKPNTRYDYYKDGKLHTSRYTDASGQPVWDVHHNDHGNPKKHPNVPHYHPWVDGKLQREMPVDEVPEFIKWRNYYE